MAKRTHFFSHHCVPDYRGRRRTVALCGQWPRSTGKITQIRAKVTCRECQKRMMKGEDQ